MAAYFGKTHHHVLDTIDALVLEAPSIATDFRGIEIEVQVGFGTRKDRGFAMTRDGFTLLAMGFTGKKALQFKLKYIEQFNAMEAELKAQAQPAAITATEWVASCRKDQSEITPHFRKSLRRETTINYHPLKERPRRGGDQIKGGRGET